VSRQPKLSLEQVEDIRRRYEPGLNSRRRGNAADLAAEFGVTQTYITILVRETRRDEDPLAARNRSDLARLLAAGLSEEAAAKVVAHPNRGPVVLAPGVIVSLFTLESGVGKVAA
jgi:hypothetical protein